MTDHIDNKCRVANIEANREVLDEFLKLDAEFIIEMRTK
jgi:hypothetical protein